MSSTAIRPESFAAPASAISSSDETAPRTRLILTGPLVPTLLRPVAPKVLATATSFALYGIVVGPAVRLGTWGPPPHPGPARSEAALKS